MARVHAVVPAAGRGQRFGADYPKQYALLHGRTVMQRSLDLLTALPDLGWVVVPVAADDPLPPTLTYAHPDRLHWVTGGETRAASVLAGLQALTALGVSDDEGVLVHDVARPLVRLDDIQRLRELVGNHPHGGLLAWPVRDTMKRTDAHGRVVETVSRAQLWHALTPQLFRLGRLRDALHQALASPAAAEITDESSAVERLGDQPLVVAAAIDNLKITVADDLALAAYWLSARESA